MTRNSAPFFLLSLVGMSLLVSVAAYAEFECSSEVSYTWTQEGTENAKNDAAQGVAQADSKVAANVIPPDKASTPASTGTQTPGPPSAAGAPTVAAELPGVKTVRFFTVRRRGADELVAKNLLEGEVQRQKLRAGERCKRAHESVGECLTTKLSIRSSTLNSLSFSARAQAEKALVAECDMEQGRCLSVEASVPSCRDLQPGSSGPKGAEADGAPAAGGGATKPAAAKSGGKPDAKDGAAKGKDPKKK